MQVDELAKPNWSDCNSHKQIQSTKHVRKVHLI